MVDDTRRRAEDSPPDDRQPQPTRRTVLGATGAAAVAALAGCSSVLGEDPPAYADDMPDADGDGVFAVHLDAEWLRTDDGDRPYAEELPGAVDPSLEIDGTVAEVDPLIGYPIGGLLVASLTVSFGAAPYGFGDELLAPFGDDVPDTEAEPEDGSGDDTADGNEASGGADGDADAPADENDGGTDIDESVRIDSILVADGVGVFRGAFDARAVVAASDGFELADERGAFDVYEGTDDGLFGTEGLAFAVADDVVVVSLTDAGDIDAALDIVAGDESGLTGDDDAAWALATAGEGHITLGAWGIDPDEATGETAIEGGESLDAATGLVSSLTLGPEAGSATLAAVYPEGDAPERAAHENDIGTSASTRDIDIDGDRLTVEGRWRVPADD